MALNTVAFFGWLLVTPTCDAQQLILRDLELLDDVEVRALDVNGIRLSDGRLIWLDDVKRASVGQNQQELDRLVQRYGRPVFQIRMRLQARDWPGALRAASKLKNDQFAMANSRIRYLVNLALMRGKLAMGQREAAIVPFLHSALIQRQMDESQILEWCSVALPMRDCQRLFSSEFLPVWFDENWADEQCLVLDREIQAKQIPRAGGVLIYHASLSLAAGRVDRVRKVLDELKRTSQFSDWSQVINGQLELRIGDPHRGHSILANQLDQLSLQPRLTAYYLQGSSYLSHPDTIRPVNASLALLTVAATGAERYPETAAAALYNASKIARSQGNLREAEILQGELLKTYSSTYHGRLVRSSD